MCLINTILEYRRGIFLKRHTFYKDLLSINFSVAIKKYLEIELTLGSRKSFKNLYNCALFLMCVR